MAKGDAQRGKNTVAEENSYLGDRINNLRFGMSEPLFNMGMANYAEDRSNDQADYGNLMGGFNKFAETGGFTPEDLGDFRARAAAPIRAAYAGANREVDRARSLNGGSMPGYAVLKSRLARDTSQGMSDANINANAAIAQLVQQGKLAGLQGGTNLYGTTPGRSALSSTNLYRGAGLNMDLLNSDIARSNARLQGLKSFSGGSRLQSITEGVGDFIEKTGKGVGAAAAPWAPGQ